jgi:hypothetical protein
MKVCLLSCLLLPPALLACSDDTPKTGPTGPTSTTIHLTSAQAPALVALRDGFGADWKPITAATSMDLTVTGPYTVAVVCQDADAWRTWQFARTPDDDKTLTAPCGGPPPARHTITGHAVRAGSVYLGDASAQSETDNWNFSLTAPTGTYDLVATTENDPLPDQPRLAIRRGIAVDANVALSTPINLDTEGQAYASVAFVTDAPLPKDSGETLDAVVELETKASLAPARLYDGPAATALVAPSALLVADDVQTVTVQAVAGTAARGLRFAYRFGDATKVTLPSGVDGGVWAVANGELSIALPGIPEVDVLKLRAAGASGDAGKAASVELDLSANYLDATGLARPTLETALPGYKPAWAVDLGKAYTRSVMSEHEVDAGVEVASDVQTVDATSTSAQR